MNPPSLAESLARLEEAQRDALALVAAGKADEARQRFLTKKGVFRQLQDLLGKLPPEDRPRFGQAFQQAKAKVEAALGQSHLAQPVKSAPAFDFLPGIAPHIGCRHVLTQTIEEIAGILSRLGFSPAEGPEIEDVFHNFIALAIPEDHPARDPRDNFYIHEGLLVRSQTSTIQVRVMEHQPPPVRVFAVGRVYRPDAFDATHSPMFHQVECLSVGEQVTMADLKTVLSLFARSYLGPEVRVRFRPSFFPFTEPSIEVDMSWGEANDRWVEMGGAGMVDPQVFEQVGYDPDRYTGFAFGLGIERLAMRRHQIPHMKLLYDNDVRFLRQFP